jgi:beta-mannosidase
MTIFAAMLLGTFAVSAALRAETPTDAKSSRVLSLSGADWRIHDDPDGKGAERGMPQAGVSSSGWTAASVPGNVQADLEAAHLLKPLWYGAGDPRLYDVARKDWWYRKDFTVPASFAGRRLTLVFDGVDHECQVWLNGRQVGSNAGMFRRFWFDVAAVVRPGAVNHLALRLTKMPDELAPLVIGTDGPMSGGPMGSFVDGFNRSRQMLKELKSPTNFGWDWGTNVWTLGIWKDVRLEATGPARIDWVRVRSELSDNYQKAVVKVGLEIDSQAELTADISLLLGEKAGAKGAVPTTLQVALNKGKNLVEAELPVDHPALWWCNGQGGQSLYTLEARIEPRGGGPAIDVRSARFGIREVRWAHTEGAPEDFLCRYRLLLNGRPVRTMGSNLIPPDLLYGRMGPRTMNLIRRAKDAGMNTLRLWGGGVILHDEAYALADELGIMLSLEMPLANAWPESDPVFLDHLQSTARNIIKQVRNHPALIEYTGGNEMPWNSSTKHPALQVLQQVAAEEDGQLMRATCPDLGATHGPSYFFNLQTDCPRFDNLTSMRAGEFGASSPANLEVWHRTIPPKSQWPINGVDEPIQVHKNIVQAVFEPDYWLRKTYLDRAFGSLDNLPDLVEAGQFYGAEGLRYEIDALRRKGKKIGGLTTWDFNEPWTNGAGSYLVDYDGRTLMNYDFLKQALAPVSLSLRYDSVFYHVKAGIEAELFLTSDAQRAATNLRWKWLARDRRGKVFARGSGVADSIEPQGVIPLKSLALRPPPETALGPVFVELGLDDAEGRPLVERLHVFGATALQAPLAGLVAKGLQDQDDASQTDLTVELPNGPTNLAFVGNGAKPATASSARPEPIHQPQGINDGAYGNAHSWIGGVAGASFQIELKQAAEIGVFRLGRDRTGALEDRPLGELKIETSTDGQAWKTVFERKGLSALPGYRPITTMEIQVAPVQAKWVRATVNAADVCLDEFEIYAPANGAGDKLPRIVFGGGPAARPVTRTTIQVEARPVCIEGEQEVLDLVVRNTGPMTALFCEPHPLIEYRTDLFIENNHCFIPPGESRTIRIKAADKPRGGLSLGQTGWRLTTWNADDVMIGSSEEVLLSLGRRDEMCREYLGYSDTSKVANTGQVSVEGNRPDPFLVPYLVDSNHAVRFEFPLSDAQAKHAARLRIHTADQAEKSPTKVAVTLNGRRMERSLPLGLGIQRTDPAHLAFPATVEFQVPAADLRPGKNTLEVRVQDDGWFSWDAMDLTSSKEGESTDGR